MMPENVNTKVGELVGFDRTTPKQTKLCQRQKRVDMHSHMTVNIISKNSNEQPQTPAAPNPEEPLTDLHYRITILIVVARLTNVPRGLPARAQNSRIFP